jgi:parallel beta-helix repeat protein
MYHDYRLFGSLTRGLLVVGCLFLITGVAFCQDYYVDAQNGDDWNNGTALAPWKTVNFALAGPHSPLPPDSTIHLYGTAGVSYGVGNGDSFPWVLYSGMSLMADNTGGSGSDWIVDASGSGQNIIVLHSGSDFVGSVIQGIEDSGYLYNLILRNGARGIVTEPVGRKLAPIIKYCTIENMSSEGIRIVGSASANVTPVIRNNTLKSNGGSHIHYEVPGCLAAGKIKDNEFSSGGSHGIYLTGIPSGGGKTEISGNDISGSVNYTYGIYMSAFTGKVECVGNSTTYRQSAIFISSCDPWDQDSKVEDNQCTASHDSAALRVSNTDDVTIKRNICVSTGYGDSCIQIDSSDRVFADTNTCSGGEHYCIYLINAQDAVLTNNVCHDSDYYDGIHLNNSDRTVLENNSCFSNGRAGVYVGTGSDEVIIRQNEIYSNGNWGARVESSADVQVIENSLTSNVSGGLYVNSTGIEVFENKITMNGGTGVLDDTCLDSSYMYNLVVKNGGDGFRLQASSSATPPKILNNTVADNNGDGIWTALSSSTGPYVANCIFFGSVGLDMSGLAYGQYYNCCAWTGNSPGNGNIKADPLFADPVNDDYHLTGASPCIGVGMNYVVKRANDLDGVPSILDGLWDGNLTVDMGTYEYTEVSSSLSGTYQQGSNLDVTVNGPVAAPFRVWLATNSGSYPLAAHPGTVFQPYGTVLLDLTKLLSYTPVASGTLDALGTATVTLALPGGLAGLYIALQTTVDDPNNPGVFGQLTEAEKFIVLP